MGFLKAVAAGIAAYRAPARADAPSREAVAIAPSAPAPRDSPGQRVHHEYFLDEGPAADGLWHWHARVYAANGEVTENSGAHPTEALAHAAAQGWAATKMTQLRSAP